MHLKCPGLRYQIAEGQCTSNDILWSELASQLGLLTMVKHGKMFDGFGDTSMRVDGIATVKV